MDEITAQILYALNKGIDSDVIADITGKTSEEIDEIKKQYLSDWQKEQEE